MIGDKAAPSTGGRFGPNVTLGWILRITLLVDLLMPGLDSENSYVWP